MQSRFLRPATPQTRRTPHRIPARTATAAFIIAALAAAAAPAAAATTRAAAPHVTAITTAHSAPAPADPNAGVQVLYNGHLTSYATLNQTLGTTYCDDFAGYGKLTCYSTQRAMETDLLASGGYTPQEAPAIARQLGVPVPAAPRTGQKTAPQATTAAAATCYPGAIVQLWAATFEKGSEVNIYCDYTNLGTIGWNGKARSADIIQTETENLYSNQDYQRELAQLSLILAQINMSSGPSSEKRTK
jgi:hypothetical protein